MPVRQLALLLGLFCLCLAIVGVAWASGEELFLFLPFRRALLTCPPTHPGVIFGFLLLCPILTYGFRQTGVYVFIAMTAGILLGSVVGFKVFQWTPSWAQLFLTAAMITTSIYAWKQEYYFEE